VVTTNANELVAEIHDRMPVILRPEDYERWLGPEADPGDMLQPFLPDLMTIWPVSTRVNTPRNDDPDEPFAIAAGSPSFISQRIQATFQIPVPHQPPTIV
jgi:putative SOS response-associated peptidase YedK